MNTPINEGMKIVKYDIVPTDVTTDLKTGDYVR